MIDFPCYHGNNPTSPITYYRLRICNFSTSFSKQTKRKNYKNKSSYKPLLFFVFKSSHGFLFPFFNCFYNLHSKKDCCFVISAIEHSRTFCVRTKAVLFLFWHLKSIRGSFFCGESVWGLCSMAIKCRKTKSSDKKVNKIKIKHFETLVQQTTLNGKNFYIKNPHLTIFLSPGFCNKQVLS